MERKNIIKFKEWKETNEDTYKVNDEGIMEKQEWELYKDWHPSKFTVSNLSKKTEEQLIQNSEFVWIIKKNDIIVSVLSGDISKDILDEFFDNLKK